MRSKIARRIIDNTPDSVRKEVRDHANKMVNMNNEEFDRIEQVIKSFPDTDKMREKYKKSALFHTAIMMLSRGVTHQELILQLIEVAEDTQKAFEYQLLTTPPNIRFEIKPK